MILLHKEDPLKFKGKNKKDNYFEGWYFKHVSSNLKNVISIIPGISKCGLDTHAFIQSIISYEIDNKIMLETHYQMFSKNDFKYYDHPFQLIIGNNTFNNEGVELNLKNKERSIQGNISFSDFTKIKRNILSPNAMGCFAYMPFMECNHDIISMNHNLKGFLRVNNEKFEFDDGKGYIEKDWGMSFPKEYIWLQSNHFDNSDASIMFSLAHIPFMGTSFQGFICNFTFDGYEYRFATYNNSRVTKIKNNSNILEFNIVKEKYNLHINAEIIMDSGTLKAPDKGTMSVQIKEGLSGTVNIKLVKGTETLFQGTGSKCAIEVHKK